MKKITEQFKKITSTALLLWAFVYVHAQIDIVSDQSLGMSIREAEQLRIQDPDSSINLLQFHYQNASGNKDTVNMIRALMGLTRVYGHQAKYKDSYDKLWTALLLANESEKDLIKSFIYRSLGRYYSFYNRKDNALKYLNLSLELSKELVEKGELDKGRLAENYLAFCATYRELKEPGMVQAYLDTCNIYFSDSTSLIPRYALDFEQAAVFFEQEMYADALELFQGTINEVKKVSPGYLVLVYYYIGETHRALDNFKESERHYLMALNCSEEYNSHLDFTPLIHERLSVLYHSIGEHQNAYLSLKKSKELDAVFFDSRSENNRALLEIQDAFREEQERLKQLLNEQEMARLEHKSNVLVLQRIILLGSIVFLLILGFIYLRNVSLRYRAEKLLLKKEQEFETRKATEIVDLKNRELAASTLKLIEKENLIDSLKEKLSQSNGEINRKEINDIIHTISFNSSENWKEFEARFVTVNKGFYDVLSERFPALTQSDKKVCALIKLGFSSKEMSKLLGISVESVHTTRYRLRKKLKLTRDENLLEYVSNI